jgi:ABC-type uncharacterized transport system YnjBCD permease subunit
MGFCYRKIRTAFHTMLWSPNDKGASEQYSATTIQVELAEKRARFLLLIVHALHRKPKETRQTAGYERLHYLRVFLFPVIAKTLLISFFHWSRALDSTSL